MRSPCKCIGVLLLLFVGLSAAMPAHGQTTINSIPGLIEELSARPIVNLQFRPPGILYVREDGTIGTLRGQSTECIRGDGSMSPCGILNASAPSVILEVPAGAVDNQNTVFQLSQIPATSASVQLYHNGLYLSQGYDYTVSGSTITFINGLVPESGDRLTASFVPMGQPAITATLAVSTESSGGSAYATAAARTAPAAVPAISPEQLALSTVAATQPAPAAVAPSLYAEPPASKGTRGVDDSSWHYRAPSPMWENFRKTVHGAVRECARKDLQLAGRSPLTPTLTIGEDKTDQ